MNDATDLLTSSQTHLAVSGKTTVRRPASISATKLEDATETVRLPATSYRIVLNCQARTAQHIAKKKALNTKS